jgi:hypothetical protein
MVSTAFSSRLEIGWPYPLVYACPPRLDELVAYTCVCVWEVGRVGDACMGFVMPIVMEMEVC